MTLDVAAVKKLIEALQALKLLEPWLPAWAQSLIRVLEFLEEHTDCIEAFVNMVDGIFAFDGEYRASM